MVRSEALRAGFKDAWQRGRISRHRGDGRSVFRSLSRKTRPLLMYYDNALMRAGKTGQDIRRKIRVLQRAVRSR